MKKTKLAAAMTSVFVGSALSLVMATEASAHVAYNTYNAYASGIGTDAAGGSTDGWSSAGSWVGTLDNNAPFGYQGPVAHWGAELDNAGSSVVVSSDDAHNDYGVWADIDTAKGAWNDKGPNGPTTSLTSQGWGHNTDLGLFKSNVTQTVQLSATSLNTVNVSNFGISVFSGMTTAGNYDHHGGWNINYRPASHTSPNTAPASLNNPLGTVGLTFLTYTDNSTLSFTAQAGQVYTILLGGYSGAGNFGPHAGYALNITSAPVPVPGAVWLFGSAMAGFIGLRRRKSVAG